MKIMWCWRCKQEIPMLDDVEFLRINQLFRECIESVQQYRITNNITLPETRVNDLFKPLVQEYERITGYKDMHHNAVMHHRISIFGDPCKKCEKPLRTPQAKMCAACGEKVSLKESMK